jgi:hypothetical protein
MTTDDWGEIGTEPQTQGLWPAGNYEGDYVEHEIGSSATKGTPYVLFRFKIKDSERVVEVTTWISEKNQESARSDMQALNPSGVYPDITFAPAGPIKLYMKHEQKYKAAPGVMEERWRISNVKPPDASFMARFFAGVQSAKPPPPPPSSRPIAPPPKAAAPPKAPPPKAPAPKAPSAPAKPKGDPAHEAKIARYHAAIDEVKDADTAWAAWCAAECEDADAFWKAVGEFGDPDSLTPAQWRELAMKAPPF